VEAVVKQTLERFRYFSFLFLLLIGSVFGSTTGKIAGRVTDKTTGEPLPGVNILVTGTRYGAATDKDGNYFIINLPPGFYEVEARMMGYGKVKTQGVKVRTDATTTVDFQLGMEVIEGQTVVVTVDAITVKRDQTSSIRSVSSDQFEHLPVESMAQVVNMQVGVVDGHFRGGRSNEVSYMIDGLQVNDVYDKAKLTDIETEVVQDMEVILGTFNAEYGRAMSGVVNAVTKEGGEKFHGMISGQLGNYYTDHTSMFIGLKPEELTRKINVRAQLQGPIYKDRLSFFINFRNRDEKNHLNGIYRFNPYDYSDFSSLNPQVWYSEHTGDGSYVPMSFYKGYSAYGKLTFKPFTGLKTNFIFNRITGESGAYSHFMKFNPYGVAHSYEDANTYTLLFNHTISRRIFHEFKINFLDNTDKYYLYENPQDPRYVSDWYSLSPGPGFSTGSQDKTHNTHRTKRLDVKYDFSWQIDNNHSIKTGFLFTDHDKDIREYQIVNKYRLASMDRMRDTLYTPEGDIKKIRYPYYTPEILADSTTYSNVYRKKPRELSAYLQDKMEFMDFVINMGLRYDRFDPRTIYPSNLRNPGNKLSYENNPERMSTYPEADVQDQISPRFGLAYTLSDQAKLHFSYGHFFQMPDAYALYTNHNFIIPEANFATTLGNPQLKPEKSVKYEVGLWQQLIKGIGVNVALYYADVYNLLSTAIITTYDDVRYGLYTNKDYGNRKGLEVALEAMFGSFAASLNYTLQYTRGNADNPTQTFTRAGSSMDPIARLIPLSWDQRHTLNATAGYTTTTYGATLTGYYNSGTTFTWTPLDDSRLALVNLYPNNSYKPANFSADLYAFYDLPLRDRFKLRFSLLVYNLFDAQNELFVDSTTGRANQQIIRETDLILHRSNFNSYQDRINNPGNLSAPREIKLSAGILF
jgi:outer membrane receptor protein involved in Fe transport